MHNGQHGPYRINLCSVGIFLLIASHGHNLLEVLTQGFCFLPLSAKTIGVQILHGASGLVLHTTKPLAWCYTIGLLARNWATSQVLTMVLI